MSEEGQTNLPVDQAAIEAKLREQAAAMKDKIGAPGGDKIRLLKTKKFKLPNGVESPGPLRGVVIDFVSFNAYFDRPYSDKDKTPPACFALASAKPQDLVPHPTSPLKQNEKCGKPQSAGCCPLNEFGSKGAGKACGNHYLLGFVEPGGDANSPLYVIQLSPKTTKHWENYANGIQMQEGMPPISVETEIFFDPNEETQVLRFNKVGKNPHLAVHYGRQEAVLRRLLTVPDVSGFVELVKPAPRKGK
jgi:hypothetical protein